MIILCLIIAHFQTIGVDEWQPLDGTKSFNRSYYREDMPLNPSDSIDGGGNPPTSSLDGRTDPVTSKSTSMVPKRNTGTSSLLVSNLSDFLSDSTAINELGDANNGKTSITAEEARRGREEILDILNDAGIWSTDASEIVKLPLWSQVQDLYYRTKEGVMDKTSVSDKSASSLYSSSGPVIIGLDTCQTFRNSVPHTKDRFIGVAGNFNTGTTAFGQVLQANCRFPDHAVNQSNRVIQDVNGMLNQVPWAKHKMAYYRDNNLNVIHKDVNKEHVLPVVMVRDPFFWMQSMCRQGYGVRWDHDPVMHCPNLVPNDFDKKRFNQKRRNRKQQQQLSSSVTDASVTASTNSTTESVRVWMGANPKVGPSWDSLVHYWNEWYESYLYSNVDRNQNMSWPRLIVRFEDTLFYPKQVMAEVCACGGGQLSANFSYLLGEAKWNHKHAQNNFVSAMVRYGSDEGGHRRYRNMTQDDIDFAKKILNPKLMEAFRYRY